MKVEITKEASRILGPTGFWQIARITVEVGDRFFDHPDCSVTKRDRIIQPNDQLPEVLICERKVRKGSGAALSPWRVRSSPDSRSHYYFAGYAIEGV
jgi:hypothetical protein